MRTFGGKFRSTVHVLNQLDTVTIEDWQSLQLDIQVRFPSRSHTYVLLTNIEILKARFGTRHRRCTGTHLAPATCAAWFTRPWRDKPASTHRDSSACSRPPP